MSNLGDSSAQPPFRRPGLRPYPRRTDRFRLVGGFRRRRPLGLGRLSRRQCRRDTPAVAGPACITRRWSPAPASAGRRVRTFATATKCRPSPATGGPSRACSRNAGGSHLGASFGPLADPADLSGPLTWATASRARSTTSPGVARASKTWAPDSWRPSRTRANRMTKGLTATGYTVVLEAAAARPLAVRRPTPAPRRGTDGGTAGSAQTPPGGDAPCVNGGVRTRSAAAPGRRDRRRGGGRRCSRGRRSRGTAPGRRPSRRRR